MVHALRFAQSPAVQHAWRRRRAHACSPCRASPVMHFRRQRVIMPLLSCSSPDLPSVRAGVQRNAVPQGLAQRTAAVVLMLSLACVPPAAAAAAADSFHGVPRIVDGDTLVVDGNKVRLFGIDAPESKQSCQAADGSQYLCGQRATELLQAKVGQSGVRCDTKATDQYNRKVAVCRTDEVEINRWLVDNGLAVAYREYSSDYVAAEDAAKAAKRGIWAGAFDIPANWRKERKIEQLEQSLGRQRGPTVDASLGRSRPAPGFAAKNNSSSNDSSDTAVSIASSQSSRETGSSDGGEATSGSREAGNRLAAPSAAATNGKSGAAQPGAADVISGIQQGKPWDTKCPNLLIKGNVTARGEKIYHMPGTRSYVSTRINGRNGERYFCSEADAQAAGWRPAR